MALSFTEPCWKYSATVRHVNLAVIVNQFRAQGVDEAPDGMFRTALGRL
jgi:hypothetical protein